MFKGRFSVGPTCKVRIVGGLSILRDGVCSRTSSKVGMFSGQSIQRHGFWWKTLKEDMVSGPSMFRGGVWIGNS